MNSKTTLFGVLTILGGLIGYALAFLKGMASEPAALGALVAALTSGIGLVLAKDATP